jgi:hypothetical protein
MNIEMNELGYKINLNYDVDDYLNSGLCMNISNNILCGFNINTLFPYLNFSISCLGNNEEIDIDATIKFNVVFYDLMPFTIGATLNSNSSENNTSSFSETNLWLFSEFGQIIDTCEIGFKFETIFSGSNIERKNANIIEHENNGLSITLYSKYDNCKLSGKIGKLDKIDVFGEKKTYNLNNIEFKFL